MRPIWKDLALAGLLGMVLPSVVLGGAMKIGERMGEATPIATVLETGEATEPERVALTVRFRQTDGTTTQMDMDTYLVGVLLAEMPSDFEPEAKKAQAVVARTFAMKAGVTGGKHGDGSVCGDSTCCQAYIDPGDYGGDAEGVAAAEEAVLATSGYVLTYEGGLIEATYFSCSGGSTEDAVAVWGTDFPYLRTVSSPGEEGAAHDSDTMEFTTAEFETALGAELSGSPEDWFGFTTYTSGGGVNTIRIGGQDYPGTELRKRLGLRSTAFTVEVNGERIMITTRGFGHRVGMSQYGADAMAAAGSDFREILSHYYRGTALERWEKN